MFNTLFGWREIRRRELKKREIEERHSISIVRLAEKKRTEKIEAWVPLKISFFSQQRRKWKESHWSFLFLFCPFLFSFRGNLSRASSPPTFFIHLGHCLPHSSSKFVDGTATSLDLSFLDLYSTTSKSDLKTTNHRCRCIKTF